MSTLSLYLTRAIVAGTALVLVVLLSLAGLIEFIAELDDMQGAYQTPQAILFTALRLPNVAFRLLPIAALLGSLLGLGALAAHSEIIVMRASGLSVRRLAGMVAVSGLVMLVFAGMLGEFVGPSLDLYARDMRIEARNEKGSELGNDAWVKDGPIFLHLERVNSEFDFGNVYLFRFNEDNELASIALADNSGLDDDDNWVLENLRETRFREDGVQVVESSMAVESFGINADLLGSSVAKPLSLSARGLLVYIDYLKRNNLDASRYETEIWYRVSRTLTLLVMPILSLAFVFGSLRSGGTGGRLMIGVVVGLAYYLASEMLSNSGRVFNLNPAIVTWLPFAALCAVTLVALARVR